MASIFEYLIKLYGMEAVLGYLVSFCGKSQEKYMNALFNGLDSALSEYRMRYTGDNQCQGCESGGDNLHTCPFAEEIHGSLDLCNCCANCCQQCAYNI